MTSKSQFAMSIVVLAATAIDCGIVYRGEACWMTAHVVVWILALAFCMTVIGFSDIED